MISKYQVIKYFKRQMEENEDFHYCLNEDETEIYDNITNTHICSVDTYLDALRKKLHCDFEVIYDEHGLLTTVFRCRECGTVIFGGDDEERYDPNLTCPTCSDYKTWLEYWSKQDIENDPEKQKTIDGLIKAQKYKIEMYRRIERRGGLSDREIWKKEFRGKNTLYVVTLERMNLWGERLKGLNLHITKFSRKNSNDLGFSSEWFKRIPLSPYAVYIQWILPYRKNTHPSIRKYHFWQKKPE